MVKGYLCTSNMTPLLDNKGLTLKLSKNNISTCFYPEMPISYFLALIDTKLFRIIKKD
jgi:hypothetical protein